MPRPAPSAPALLAPALLTLAALLAACAPERPFAPTSHSPSLDVGVDVTAASAKKTATLTVALDMQPNRTVDVSFVTEGKQLKNFALDDDANSATPNTITFAERKAGTYTVRAGVLPGLAFTQLSCTSEPNGGSGTDNNTVDAATGTATIQLETGESVVCTFTGSIPLWQQGDLVTRTQLGWDNTTDWFNAYNQVYASTFGIVEVGLPGASGFSLRFTSPDAVRAFFVQSGLPAPLEADLLDTTGSSSRGFGGEVLALRLNIDFSAAEFLSGAAGIAFGGLTLCDMTDASLNGKTVTDVLGLANTLLGGGSNGYLIVPMTDLVTQLNAAFSGSTPSPFAQSHLAPGACP